MNTASDEAEKTSTKSFVLQVASVSPVYSNNPTFRVMSLDTRERALVDYDQYYLDSVLVTGIQRVRGRAFNENCLYTQGNDKDRAVRI